MGLLYLFLYDSWKLLRAYCPNADGIGMNMEHMRSHHLQGNREVKVSLNKSRRSRVGWSVGLPSLR